MPDVQETFADSPMGDRLDGELAELRAETTGDPRVCVAILDGPVDPTHLAFRGARIRLLETLAGSVPDSGPATRHGTHVASVVFGQHEGPVRGIAPGCSGLVIPIFSDSGDGSTRSCSQIDLGRAINLAIASGAQIINISGGQSMPSGEAHPLLANVVRSCARSGILIVAAAGNDGCECLQIPGALPSVLAVGAMDRLEAPTVLSNWGKAYRRQGLLAPGEDILGAIPGGGVAAYSGTSFATAMVSGIAALLMSLQIKERRPADPLAVREALLRTAVGCDVREESSECRRLLAGRLNIRDTVNLLRQGASIVTEDVPNPSPLLAISGRSHPETAMIEPGRSSEDLHSGDAYPATSVWPRSDPGTETDGRHAIGPACAPRVPEAHRRDPSRAERRPPRDDAHGSLTDAISPSGGCSCGGGNGNGGPPQLIYALGLISYDFSIEARRDSIADSMDGNPADRRALLAYLEENPWDSAAIIWTLDVDSLPIYAIEPQGPYANETYARIRRFLREQIEEGVERVSIPAFATGKSATMLSGMTIPIIRPEIRGMASWTTRTLVESVAGPQPSPEAIESVKAGHVAKTAGVGNFLDRVYYELRNFGMTPQERALNFAATNAFLIERAFEDALKSDMELDTIDVERSPICRPDSECWDVKLYFFFPLRDVQTVRRVYRFTVDVSDTVPVMIGGMRVWSIR